MTFKNKISDYIKQRGDYLSILMAGILLWFKNEAKSGVDHGH